MNLAPATLEHGEQWKTIHWAPNYEVSDAGRVRSLDRTVNQWRVYSVKGRVERKCLFKGRILKPFLQKAGYPAVKIHPRGTVLIHELVLTAFRGPRPGRFSASHLNGVRNDNRLANLVWESMLDNIRRQAEHGTKTFGERKGGVRLTEVQAREIKAVKNPPHGWYAMVSKVYGVHENTVRDVHQGRTWRHL